MSVILDKIESELIEFAETDESAGGIQGVLDINSVQVGDPGWLVHSEYPYIMVENGTIVQKMATTQWDTFSFNYTITIMVDATDYFVENRAGNDAERPLADAGTALMLWFYRVANRKLDQVVPGIRDVTVSSVDFPPDERGEVYAKRALLVVTVDRQFPHKP